MPIQSDTKTNPFWTCIDIFKRDKYNNYNWVKYSVMEPVDAESFQKRKDNKGIVR